MSVQGQIQSSDGDDRYSEASFVADDSLDKHDDSARQAEGDADDGGGYDGEEFEEADDLEPQGDEGIHEDEYSDDFSEPDLHHEVLARRESSQSTGTTAPTACDKDTQQPEDDLPSFVEEWAQHKTRFVWNRAKSRHKKDREASHDSSKHQNPLPDAVIAAISERLMQRTTRIKDKSTQQHARRLDGLRVPSTVMDRVRVQHLVALSAKPPPPPAPSRRQSRNNNSISTFCSVKATYLSGKLATTRLDDLLAKWHAPSDSIHTVSRGVMDFIASTAQQHRRQAVLRASNGDDCVFRAMRSRTVDLERTVQVATDAVADSKLLLLEAQRILSTPDAHQCHCNTSPSIDTNPERVQ